MADYQTSVKRGERQKPTNGDYREGWERIWGEKKKEESKPDTADDNRVQ